jgi:hypothetical protein
MNWNVRPAAKPPKVKAVATALAFVFCVLTAAPSYATTAAPEAIEVNEATTPQLISELQSLSERIEKMPTSRQRGLYTREAKRLISQLQKAKDFQALELEERQRIVARIENLRAGIDKQASGESHLICRDVKATGRNRVTQVCTKKSKAPN